MTACVRCHLPRLVENPTRVVCERCWLDTLGQRYEPEVLAAVGAIRQAPDSDAAVPDGDRHRDPWARTPGASALRADRDLSAEVAAALKILRSARHTTATQRGGKVAALGVQQALESRGGAHGASQG